MTYMNRIQELRDELYDSLPSGEVQAFDLLKIIKDHIAKLDEMIDLHINP